MTGREWDETSLRGEALVQLRHGISQSSRLAEQLAGDAIVGGEARGLLGRLQAIRVELDALAVAWADLRWHQDEPYWNEPPYPFHYGRSNQTGM